MRLQEDIERSGYFWLPGKDDYKAPGTLRISEGGNISLEIIGSFSGPTGAFKELNEDMSIGRIVGHVEKAGLVTLEECFFTKRHYAFGGIAKSQIAVNCAVLGVAFDADEEILFDEFVASIEGLDHWIGKSGISIELASDLRNFAVNYEQPASLNLVKNKCTSVTVDFGYSIPSGTRITEATIRQHTFLKVSAVELKRPEFFMDLLNRLKDFLSLALDETVSLRDVSAFNSTITVETGKGGSKAVRMDVYYETTNHVDTLPKLDRHRMLFRYGDISDSPEKILATWLSLYETVDPVMNLYFAAKAGAYKYFDSRFLALAQALETLHRRTSSETVMKPDEFKIISNNLVDSCPDVHKEWLEQRLAYGNEISLARRVARLLEAFPKQFGDKAKRKKVARMIADTRNYLTHYDQKLSGKTASGRDLWVLCLKMEALLQLHLLRMLSFTDEQIDRICSGPHGLTQKLEAGFGEA